MAISFQSHLDLIKVAFDFSDAVLNDKDDNYFEL